mgnify:CR=1 FL=1
MGWCVEQISYFKHEHDVVCKLCDVVCRKHWPCVVWGSFGQDVCGVDIVESLQHLLNKHPTPPTQRHARPSFLLHASGSPHLLFC